MLVNPFSFNIFYSMYKHTNGLGQKLIRAYIESFSQVTTSDEKKRHIQPFPKQALVFTCLQHKSFKNTVGNGEIAHDEQFLSVPHCFLLSW